MNVFLVTVWKGQPGPGLRSADYTDILLRDPARTECWRSESGRTAMLEHFKVEMRYIHTKKTTRRHPVG